jgi:uncharacterized protein YbaP (TraB family)
MLPTRLLKRLSAVGLALVSVFAPPIAFASAATVTAVRAPAKHMLFKVRGRNGAIVYLLGSVHLLTPEAGALPAEIDSAFARAKTIAFETSIDSVQMRGQEMLAKARYANGGSLRASLSAAGIVKADSIVKQYGLTLDQLNGFKPWFVSLALNQMVMQKAGYQVQYGVDMQLNTRARNANKRVIGLESVDFQLNLFDTILPEDQELMVTTAKGPGEAAKELTKIKDAWLAGDVAALEQVFKQSQEDSPRLLDLMLNKRNESWMPAIDLLLNGKDDALVVVGAAHLMGDKGLLKLLKAKGYEVEQM